MHEHRGCPEHDVPRACAKWVVVWGRRSRAQVTVRLGGRLRPCLQARRRAAAGATAHLEPAAPWLYTKRRPTSHRPEAHYARANHGARATQVHRKRLFRWAPGAKRAIFTRPERALAEPPLARPDRDQARSHLTASPAGSRHTRVKELCVSWGAAVTRTTARLCVLWVSRHAWRGGARAHESAAQSTPPRRPNYVRAPDGPHQRPPTRPRPTYLELVHGPARVVGAVGPFLLARDRSATKMTRFLGKC